MILPLTITGNDTDWRTAFNKLESRIVHWSQQRIDGYNISSSVLGDGLYYSATTALSSDPNTTIPPKITNALADTSRPSYISIDRDTGNGDTEYIDIIGEADIYLRAFSTSRAAAKMRIGTANTTHANINTWLTGLGAISHVKGPSDQNLQLESGSGTLDLHTSDGLIATVENVGITLEQGDYIWLSGTAYEGVLAHSNSASRTWTFPNVTGTVWTSGGANNWDTGLGAIAHITGPTDQTLKIVAATSKALEIGSNATALLTFSTDGGTGTFADGVNLATGTSSGMKIGTSTSQKLGFYNATPVAQQTGVAVTAAGIHAALVSLGLITA